jgi:N,N'-diacetyllegionaminate synthase
MKVYVLGAGMSGLSTAERILELGIGEVQIIEESDTPGGLAKSFEWGGFKYNDLGPHIWHTPDPGLASEWKKKFGNLLTEGSFWGKNVIGEAPGKYVDYPLSRKTLSTFDTETAKKIEEELKSCTKEAQVKARNFNEYVEALVGPTLTNMFFKEYPEKLWGIPTSEMTSNWAPKRISFTETPEQFHGKQWVGIGTKGSGELIRVITERISDLGGNFSFNSKVTGIETSGKAISAIIVNGKKRIKIEEDDRIVSTLPFNYFASLLGIENELSYRGALLIYASLRKEVAIAGDASFLYFAQKSVPFHRLSEQKKFCGIGWPSNQTTLVAEIAFNEQEKDHLDIESLTKQTLAGLSEFGLAKPDEVIETLAIALPRVYPLMTAEKEIEFKEVYSKIQDFTQVFLIGTGGEFHYADLQILYLKGRDLAQRIYDERFISLNNTIENSKPKTEGFFPTSPFLIAEIGLNHGGSVPVAKELIIAAKNAGVEYVKFQTYRSELRISKAYGSNGYFEEVIDTEENLFQMFKKCEFEKTEWQELFDYSRDNQMKMFSAVFDHESLELLESLNCPAYKIASMDLNNYPLIEAVAKTGKPIILSTGMSSMGEIERAVGIIERSNPQEFIILHCISSYPAAKDSLNLRAMETLAKTFGRPVGFSDHSIGIEVPIIATAIGAACVEKHFTLSQKQEGPDHIFSVDPTELGNLARIINDIPLILGKSSRVNNRQEVEASFKFKKSIHARRELQAGEVIQKEDLIIKGPYGGIPPEFLEIIVGRAIKVNLGEDFPITWDMI